MITPDLSWDLNAQIQMVDTNANVFKQTISGRFNPSTTDPEKLQTLLENLVSLTRNTYVDSSLTMKKSLNEIIDDEEQEG